jgi:3-hydroxybutyryl-CoA dehydrogenase
MGHGIAQVFAQGGCHVRMQDVSDTSLENARKRIRLNLEALSEHGLEEQDRIDEVMSRITSTVSLEEAVYDADFVTEAISENLELKRELFSTMASYVKPDTILASNTSMLKISDIGRETKGQERLIINHWFNPPYLIPAVEVVQGKHTSQKTVESSVAFLTQMGKTPIRVLKEVPGHLLNRVQFAMFREILGLLENEVATAEEIDRALTASLGLRFATIGPLRTIDLAGLDLFWHGMRDMFKHLDNSPEPHKIIQDKVKAGQLGKKSGKGFYEYASGDPIDRVERDRDSKIMKLLPILYSSGQDHNG